MRKKHGRCHDIHISSCSIFSIKKKYILAFQLNYGVDGKKKHEICSIVLSCCPVSNSEHM